MENKVSVIVPIYGVEKYIERCARSLFEQTLDNIEYIFIDDCSPDNSVCILKNILNEYANRIDQTRIISMPENCGLPVVRMHGAKLATGKYIAFCDSDDWVKPDTYEKFYNCAEANNYDIVFCNYYKSDGKVHEQIKKEINITTKETLLIDISQKAAWTIWSAFVKRELYSHIEFPTQNNGEDFATLIQLIHYAQTFHKIEEPLYYYYHNSESITNTRSITADLNRYQQLIKNTELVIDFFKKHKKEDDYKDLIILYKLYCRTKISHLTTEQKYYKLWNETYPELNFYNILTNATIPLRTRLHYIAVRLKLYNYIFK